VTQGPTCKLRLVPSDPYGDPAGDRLVNTDITDDHFNLEQLKGWVSDCDHHHRGQCHSIHANDFFQFPDEIILIDVVGGKLTICHHKERYSAPSYVWGRSDQAFATLRSNFTELLKGGGLFKYRDMLPTTIKDAISLTNALSIPYLWVDRLFIVQDDDQSKQHNISWMASIYANSYLAIIAAEGKDTYHGIRGIDNSSGPWRGNVKYQFAGIRCARIPEREEPKMWHTRGWNFQERILPRRSWSFMEPPPLEM
jgi:hypothetical protein